MFYVFFYMYVHVGRISCKTIARKITAYAVSGAAATAPGDVEVEAVDSGHAKACWAGEFRKHFERHGKIEKGHCQSKFTGKNASIAHLRPGRPFMTQLRSAAVIAP